MKVIRAILLALVLSSPLQAEDSAATIYTFKGRLKAFKEGLAEIAPGINTIFLSKASQIADAEKQPTYRGVLSKEQGAAAVTRFELHPSHSGPSSEPALDVTVSTGSVDGTSVLDVAIQGKNRQWTTVSSVYPGQYILISEPAANVEQGFVIVFVVPQIRSIRPAVSDRPGSNGSPPWSEDHQPPGPDGWRGGAPR